MEFSDVFAWKQEHMVVKKDWLMETAALYTCKSQGGSPCKQPQSSEYCYSKYKERRALWVYIIVKWNKCKRHMYIYMCLRNIHQNCLKFLNFLGKSVFFRFPRKDTFKIKFQFFFQFWEKPLMEYFPFHEIPKMCSCILTQFRTGQSVFLPLQMQVKQVQTKRCSWRWHGMEMFLFLEIARHVFLEYNSEKFLIGTSFTVNSRRSVWTIVFSETFKIHVLVITMYNLSVC